VSILTPLRHLLHQHSKDSIRSGTSFDVIIPASMLNSLQALSLDRHAQAHLWHIWSESFFHWREERLIAWRLAEPSFHWRCILLMRIFMCVSSTWLCLSFIWGRLIASYCEYKTSVCSQESLYLRLDGGWCPDLRYAASFWFFHWLPLCACPNGRHLLLDLELGTGERETPQVSFNTTICSFHDTRRGKQA
jgi:hypothetical protein